MVVGNRTSEGGNFYNSCALDGIAKAVHNIATKSLSISHKGQDKEYEREKKRPHESDAENMSEGKKMLN